MSTNSTNCTTAMEQQRQQRQQQHRLLQVGLCNCIQMGGMKLTFQVEVDVSGWCFRLTFQVDVPGWSWRFTMTFHVSGYVIVIGGATTTAPTGPDWKISHCLSKTLAYLDIMGASLNSPIRYSAVIYGGFQGDLNWPTMMPRGACLGP